MLDDSSNPLMLSRQDLGWSSSVAGAEGCPPPPCTPCVWLVRREVMICQVGAPTGVENSHSSTEHFSGVGSGIFFTGKDCLDLSESFDKTWLGRAPEKDRKVQSVHYTNARFNKKVLCGINLSVGLICQWTYNYNHYAFGNCQSQIKTKLGTN